MDIVFFGASNLGYQCCKSIIDAGFNVKGIVTIPQNFNISYSKKPVKNVLHADFHQLAAENDIPIVEVNADLKEKHDEIICLKADLFIAIGWYYMISGKLLSAPSKGVIGIHGSLLPKYRGNAPLVWAIINGEKETGISLFYFTKGVDEGDIISQVRIPIEDDETIADLLQKVETSSKEVLLEYLPQIADGTAPRIAQNHEDATYFPARSPQDGLIDWSWSNERIKNFIRAQSKPYPGAFTLINGKKVQIWNADITDSEE